jgi:hypothetical protein
MRFSGATVGTPTVGTPFIRFSAEFFGRGMRMYHLGRGLDLDVIHKVPYPKKSLTRPKRGL